MCQAELTMKSEPQEKRQPQTLPHLALTGPRTAGLATLQSTVGALAQAQGWGVWVSAPCLHEAWKGRSGHLLPVQADPAKGTLPAWVGVGSGSRGCAEGSQGQGDGAKGG